jgi:hypothetical protein
MARPGGPILREGIIAGVIGAVVVALWFFVFDLARGRPLLTPALLGSVVFHGVTTPIGVEPTFATVMGYTVIHVLAFVAFGIVAAAVIAASEQESALLVAVVILFTCFETFFLGVVSVLGQSMMGALVWWAILIGNFLAAVAMLWYFLLRHRSLPRVLVGSWGGVLGEGAVAGLLGAAAVALWFLVIDFIHGGPLQTPNVLGTAFLRADPGAPAILLYSAVHVAAFVVFGVVASVLIAGAERDPMFVFALVILFTAFEVLFLGALAIGARWVLEELPAWQILVGNVLAASVMLAYFFTGHRSLARRMGEAWADED